MADRADIAPESGAEITSAEQSSEEAPSEALRRGIETSRAALDDKLSDLQDKMDAVQTKARRAVDLRHQIEQHPWVALCTSVAAGFVAGSLGSVAAEERDAHALPEWSEAAETRSAADRSQQSDSSREVLAAVKLAVAGTLVDLARQAIRTYGRTLGLQLVKFWEDREHTSVPAEGEVLGADGAESKS